MASVFKRKTDKRRSPWRFKFKDYRGQWECGIGWPDKKKTLEHAQAAEAEHRAIRKGEKEIPPAWLKLRNTPIQQVIDDYVEWGKSDGGRNGYGWSKRHCKDRIAKLKYWVKALNLHAIGDITLAGVEKQAQRLARRRGRKTVNNYAEAVKALCHWAADRSYLKENVLMLKRIRRVKPKVPHRALAKQELQRLLEEAPSGRGLLYRTALATGYRAGELRAQRVRDLDRFGCVLRLSGEFTKNRKDAEQPISRELAAELHRDARGRARSDPLLPVPGPGTVSENFRRDCAKAGIHHVTAEGKATFHSLRVNFINAVVESGSDLKTIMTLARHGSAQMSMETYAKPNPKLLRAAVKAVSERVKEVAEGPPWCVFGAEDETESEGHRERSTKSGA